MLCVRAKDTSCWSWLTLSLYSNIFQWHMLSFILEEMVWLHMKVGSRHILLACAKCFGTSLLLVGFVAHSCKFMSKNSPHCNECQEKAKTPFLIFEFSFLSASFSANSVQNLSTSVDVHYREGVFAEWLTVMTKTKKRQAINLAIVISHRFGFWLCCFINPFLLKRCFFSSQIFFGFCNKTFSYTSTTKTTWTLLKILKTTAWFLLKYEEDLLGFIFTDPAFTCPWDWLRKIHFYLNRQVAHSTQKATVTAITQLIKQHCSWAFLLLIAMH